MAGSDSPSARLILAAGAVIPAHPLALTSQRKLDERRQRALTRYYLSAGAGGLAVGVHTTQFAIRERGLYRQVLDLAMRTARELGKPPVMIAGLVGKTPQAMTEAEMAVALGYDAGLLSLGAWRGETEEEILDHCAIMAETIPLFGFYLQPAVGGRPLSYRFWRAFAEIPNVWAIKIAPFSRYQTFDVVRAIVESGRSDIALYTGNDDNIIADLITPFPVSVGGQTVVRWFDGGLLGQWAVWTRAAVRILERVKSLEKMIRRRRPIFFDSAPHSLMPTPPFSIRLMGSQGVFRGIHEVLRRQGLLENLLTLDPDERLSPGQADEITRVHRTHVELNDDEFVAEHLDEWLS